jgi:hypothetical protein
MEASVCLPCDVSQKWSGLEPWQWCRRCSRSGRALGALCPVRASKAVVASLSFALHLLEGDQSVIVRRQANAVPRLKAGHAASFAYTDRRRARPAQLLPSACSSRHCADGGRTVSSDPAFCPRPDEPLRSTDRPNRVAVFRILSVERFKRPAMTSRAR